MKVLDVTSMQSGRSGVPSMRTVDVMNDPEGGQYCLHLHNRAHYSLMHPREDGQVVLYQFGAGATFFNDADVVDVLISNPDFQRMMDLGELDLTDGKGYRILEHNTGQWVIDTKLQRGENQGIPVAQLAELSATQKVGKYYKGNNTSAFAKKTNIVPGFSGNQPALPSPLDPTPRLIKG